MPRQQVSGIPPLKPHQSGQARVYFAGPFQGKREHYLGKRFEQLVPQHALAAPARRGVSKKITEFVI